jgi:hypothetical protein
LELRVEVNVRWLESVAIHHGDIANRSIKKTPRLGRTIAGSLCPSMFRGEMIGHRIHKMFKRSNPFFRGWLGRGGACESD